jgi:hypothetical protein
MSGLRRAGLRQSTVYSLIAHRDQIGFVLEFALCAPKGGQNFDQGRPEGTLRIPWLLVRAALRVEECPLYLGANPSKKSVQRIKPKISELLVPGKKGSWPDVRDRLNRLLSRISCARTMDVRRGSYGDAGRKAGCRKRSGLLRAQPPRPSSTLLIRAQRSPTSHRGYLAVLIWRPEHFRSGGELLPVD